MKTLFAGNLLDSTLDQPMGEIANKVQELVDSFWWLFLTLGAILIVIWGGYLGVKYIIAQKNEQKIESRDLVKQLVIGILIIVAITVGGPLLVRGLASWTGTDISDDSGFVQPENVVCISEESLEEDISCDGFALGIEADQATIYSNL